MTILAKTLTLRATGQGIKIKDHDVQDV